MWCVGSRRESVWPKQIEATRMGLIFPRNLQVCKYVLCCLHGVQAVICQGHPFFSLCCYRSHANPMLMPCYLARAIVHPVLAFRSVERPNRQSASLFFSQSYQHILHIYHPCSLPDRQVSMLTGCSRWGKEAGRPSVRWGSCAGAQEGAV